MFELHNERCEAKKGDLLFVCLLVQREGGERQREKKRRKQRGGGCVWVGLFASRETGLRWFGVVWRWFGGGLGLTWQVYVIYVIQMLLNSFFKSSYYHKVGVKKVVWCGLDVVWGGLGWFGGGLGWFGGGLGLTWQVYVIYVIQMLLNSFFKSSYYHKNILWVLRKWFGVV